MTSTSNSLEINYQSLFGASTTPASMGHRELAFRYRAAHGDQVCRGDSGTDSRDIYVPGLHLDSSR